jgi:hypothetical protein
VKYTTLGGAGQWLGLGATGAAIALGIGAHQDASALLLAGGSILFSVATKIKYAGAKTRERKRVTLYEMIEHERRTGKALLCRARKPV